MRKKKIKYRGEEKVYWRVYWRLNDKLPLALERKQINTKRMPDYSCLFIKDIEVVGELECGDLTVAHPDHCFVADDWVVVGNSGKTEKGSEYVLNKMLSKPNQRWWACAESFQDSIGVQQRKIWKLLPKNVIKYGKYSEVNGFTNRKLILTNGSILIFKSYDQEREAFQGDDIDGIWFDEECPYDIYKEARMRLLDRSGEIIFTMTSLKGVTDLIQDIFEDHDVLKSQYAPLVDKTLPRIVEKNGMRFYLLWTTENPYIDQSRTVDETKLMTRQEIESRIYGMPINLSGKIYMSFNKDIHVIPFEDVPFSNVTLYNILDPHDRKPWALKWIAVHKTGKAYCVDEYPDDRNFNEMTYDDKTYAEYAKIIKDKEEVLKEIFGVSVRKRIIDPNYGNTTIKLAERQGNQSSTTPRKELRKHGLSYSDGIDALEAGHLKVREVLHYETKDNEIVVQPRYFITDNCENSIRHISRYSRKDILTSDGDVKDKVGVKEKYKDFNDLDRYFWMANPKFIDPRQNMEAPTGPKIY